MSGAVMQAVHESVPDVRVVGAYAIKDALKARGYRFSSGAWWRTLPSDRARLEEMLWAATELRIAVEYHSQSVTADEIRDGLAGSSVEG